MSYSKVESILGVPKDHSTGPLVAKLSPEEIWPEWKDRPEEFAEGILQSRREDIIRNKWHSNKEWITDDLLIKVTFDYDGLVVSKLLIDVRPKVETAWDIVERWLEPDREITIPITRVHGGLGQ